MQGWAWCDAIDAFFEAVVQSQSLLREHQVASGLVLTLAITAVCVMLRNVTKQPPAPPAAATKPTPGPTANDDDGPAAADGKAPPLAAPAAARAKDGGPMKWPQQPSPRQQRKQDAKAMV